MVKNEKKFGMLMLNKKFNTKEFFCTMLKLLGNLQNSFLSIINQLIRKGSQSLSTRPHCY